MRTKMIAGNLLAVLVVGLVSFFVVSAQLEAALLGDLDRAVARDQVLFDQTWRLWGLELAEQAEQQAREDASTDIFSALDESDRRARAFARATRIHDWFGRQNRGNRGAAEIVVVVDDDGRVIARSQDRNRMHGDDLRGVLGGLAGVLARGGTSVDVWEFASGQEKVLQTAIAAIVDPATGRPMGALVVGYDVSNGMAARAGALLGRDVAFVRGQTLYSASFEGDAVDQLRSALFGEEHRARTEAALGEAGTASDPFRVEIGGSEYVALTAPLSSAASARVASVVLANRTQQAERGSSVRTILVMTAVGAAIVIVFCFLLASSFLKPIEEMEEGVLAVINGRTDLRLDIESAELGGLAYRINQLLNVFTGTPEADADGRISSPPAAWSDGGPAPAQVPGAPRVPAEAAAAAGEVEDEALAAELAAEPEDAYYDRIFEEYVAAKQAMGENVANITKDKFVMRLQANEKSLIKKHDCRMVRFQVQTKGTQVNLRPVVIR